MQKMQEQCIKAKEKENCQVMIKRIIKIKRGTKEKNAIFCV